MKSQLKNNERGVALLIALIALLLLTAIAATMIFSSNIESGINTNYRAEQQAYFGARAGIEEARTRMLRPTTSQNPPAGTGDLCGGSTANITCPNLPQNVPGGGGAVATTDMIYIMNPSTVNAAPGGAVETVDPTVLGSNYFDDELCKENYNTYGLANPGKGLRCSAVPAATWFRKPSQINAALADSLDPSTRNDKAMAYKWVRIAQKQNWSSNAFTVDGANPPTTTSANPYSPVCYTSGGLEVLQSSLAGYGPNCFSTGVAPDAYRPVYVLTALAVTPNGSRRYVQAEVADTPPITVNASLDTQSIVNINGASVTVDGNDNCHCTCPVAKGNAAPTCTDNVTGKACTTGQQAIYSTQQVCDGASPPSCQGAVIAPVTPVVTQNASTFPYDINALINQYKNAAGTITDPGGTQFGVMPSPFPPVGDPGAPAEYPCNHPSGPTSYDVTTGQWCGQVTYVSSSTSIQGLSGAGVLVVDGDLTLKGGGGSFYGLIIVRGTLTISGNGCGQNCGLMGGVITGTGTVTDTNDTIGGGVTIQYDSCALNHNQTLAPPTVLSLREVSF